MNIFVGFASLNPKIGDNIFQYSSNKICIIIYNDISNIYGKNGFLYNINFIFCNFSNKNVSEFATIIIILDGLIVLYQTQISLKYIFNHAEQEYMIYISWNVNKIGYFSSFI